MMAAAIIALHGASVSLNKIGPASRRQSCCAPRALPDIDNRSRRAAGRIWQRCTAGRKQIWPGAELARVCIRSLSRIRASSARGGAAADAQAAQEARLRTQIAGHRQAALLRLGVPASAADL